MARLPIPNRAQPLDVSYISSIAKEVNALSEQGSAFAQGQNFLFSGKDAVDRSSKIYGAQIFASIKKIDPKVVTAAQSISEPFNFTTGFAYPPVLQATVENTGETNTAIDVSVSIQNVTTTSATVVVKFATAGTASINIHLMAIGLPIS